MNKNHICGSEVYRGGTVKGQIMNSMYGLSTRQKFNSNLHKTYLCDVIYEQPNIFYFKKQFDLTSYSILLCFDPQVRLLDANSHITACFLLTLKWFPLSSM